ANCASSLEIGDKDIWSKRKLQASLPYIHLGLRESLPLPFSDWSEDGGEVIHKSHLTHKDFLGIYTMAMRLSHEFPDDLAPYLEFADSLHIEMLFRYPAVFDYNHQMSKFWGSDPDGAEKNSIY